MRKTIITLLVIVLCWIGYVASPLIALHDIVRAFEASDAATLSQNVNFPALRRSLSEQIMQTYIRRAGLHMSPLAQSIVGSALSIADPLVDKMVSPAALSAFMTTGWPSAVLLDPPPGTVGISSRALGTAWQVFMTSRFGIARAEMRVPASFPRAQRFGLQFRISHWRWQLAGVVLPGSILDALADELIRITKTPARSP